MTGNKLAIPNGSLIDLDRPTPVAWFNSVGIRSWSHIATGPNFGAAVGDGKLFVWGHDGKQFLSPRVVPHGKGRIIDIQCSNHGIFLLLDDGRVKKVGWQDGLVEEIIVPGQSTFWKSKWKSMSIGGKHFGLIDDSGRLWTSGDNTVGQCGQPVGAVAKRNFHGKEKAAFVEETPVPLEMVSEKVSGVACGGQHTIVLTTDNRVFACGDDSKIQLGLGDTRSQESPDYVPHSGMGAMNEGADFRKMFKTTMGAIKYNWYEKHFRDRLTQVRLPSEETVAAVIAGSEFTLVKLSPSDMLLACGENQKGQCGRGFNKQQQTFSPVKLPRNIEVQQVKCGSSHCVARLVDGSIWTWGDNKRGQLGTGSRSPACPPVVILGSKIRGPLKRDIITPIGKSATLEEMTKFETETTLDKSVSVLQAPPSDLQPSNIKDQLIEAVDSSRALLMMNESEQAQWEPIHVDASYDNTILILKRKQQA